MNKYNPLELLNTIIENTVYHINDFTFSPKDFTRNRKLNASTTLKTILNMQGNSLNAELLNLFPNIEDRMTASAFEQAKSKLKTEVFYHILNEYNQTIKTPKLLNNKYHVFAVDGSDFSLPYNKNSIYSIQNNTNNKPYSILHANLLFDIENRIYQDCIIQSKTSSNERSACIDMLNKLDLGKFIVIMDRGYDGFNMLETCNRLDDCYYIIRTRDGLGGIREIAELPNKEIDIDMEFLVTTSNNFYKQNKSMISNVHFIGINKKNKRWDFEQFTTVKCRVCKFRINNNGKDEYEVLVTNLNRIEFPLLRMKEMYHKRWDIETSFRELKYALGGVNFHSKKDNFIEMELIAHLIMFNVVSRTISNLKISSQSHKKHTYSIDFKMACMIVRKYFSVRGNNKNKLYTEIAFYTVPIRKDRANRRKIKPKGAIWFVYRVA